KLLIRSNGKEVLCCMLYRFPIVGPNIGVTARTIGWADGLRIETQVLLDIRVYGNGTNRAGGKVGYLTGTNGVGNCELGKSCSPRLAHALVVAEEKDLVLQDAPSCRRSELILHQMLFGQVICIIEVIWGVKFVIAQKIKGTSVEGVVARPRDCVDY